MHLFLAATMSNPVPNDIPSPCGPPPSPHINDVMPHRLVYKSAVKTASLNALEHPSET